MRGNITFWFSFDGFVVDTMDETRKQEQWTFPYELLLTIPAFSKEKVEELRKESHAYHFHKDGKGSVVEQGNIPTKYFGDGQNEHS